MLLPGPHVSIAAGARLRNAIVRDAIINENATIDDILIEGSVVGENAVVRGAFKRLNVGDSSEVDINYWPELESLRTAYPDARLIYTSKKAESPHTAFSFKEGDFLVLHAQGLGPARIKLLDRS